MCVRQACTKTWAANSTVKCAVQGGSPTAQGLHFAWRARKENIKTNQNKVIANIAPHVRHLDKKKRIVEIHRVVRVRHALVVNTIM